MNLILVRPEDYIKQHTVRLSDRRLAHIRDIHRAQLNQSLKVGEINGDIGTGMIVDISHTHVTLSLTLSMPPPPPLPITLLLALPRPKMLKRILQTVSAMGVKEIYLLNSYKVDKSYWSTPVLSPASIEEHLLLGLEQAGDTVIPNVHLRKRFKPFLEDELDAISLDSQKLVAHPYSAQSQARVSRAKTTLAIGPEGGFIDYEIDKFQSLGFNSLSLGQRILKVETAIPVALSKLFSF